MELDKRIIKGKRPLTCFDIKEARKYVGKLCYVSNSYDCFRDLKNLVEEVILIDVEDCETPFHFYIDNQREFCLPAEWVKPEEPEKKYRPYTLAEWADKHEIGEIIHFSYKDGRQEFNVMYTGYVIEHGEDIQDVRTIGRIMLLGTAYFLEDLFENYVICINGIWQPFGVVEE